MSWLIAFKAFFKALKNPKLGKEFVEGIEKNQPISLKQDYSHLRILSMLQQSGRLIDFLKEDISGYSDAQVGACARTIHTDCAKLIEDSVTIRPVMEEEEGSQVVIQSGFDPQKIKLVGRIKGDAPYQGTVVHKGWKAHKYSLPKHSEDQHEILYAAEIEIK